MSWKDLHELAPQLTEAEVRYERVKRVVGLFLGPLCFIALLLSPTWDYVSPLGMRSLGIFCWAIVWWVTEAVPIPATALLILPLMVITGVFPLEKAFSYWSHWICLFMIGAFIIGHAMQLHGLTRRFALTLVSSKIVGGNSWRLLVLYLVATAVASGFMSNVVTSVLFLGMGIGLLETLKIKPGSNYGMALFLGIAWVTNIGGMLTPGGTPTNMIAIGLLEKQGHTIGYPQWMLASLPFAILQLIAMFWVLRFFMKKDERYISISQESIREELHQLGRLSRGEILAGLAFLAAVLLWMMPDLVVSPMFLGPAHPVSQWLRSHMNWGSTAILVAMSLFVLPVDWKTRKFVMTWPEAAKNVEWGTVALIAGALAIGDLVGDKEVGLGTFFSHHISSFAGQESSKFIFLIVAIVLAVILTNLATTVAVISFMGPLAIAVGPGLGLNPIALTIVLSYAATMGYLFPMANPPCAIVFASGYIRILPMFVRGSLLALIGTILLGVVGYTAVDWVFPWPGIVQ